MNQSIVKICIATLFMLTGAITSHCQTDLPEVFTQGTISDQLDYLNDHTRIYENYRAIREDIFRKMSRNTLDTLKYAYNRISELKTYTSILDNQIDSLQKSLEATKTQLEKMTRTKNSIAVLGMEINKTPYNTFTWTIIASLLVLLAIGYLSYRQNRSVTLKTKKDLNELKAEFEEYRQKTRIEREKMNIDHFNEIKKLKAGRI